LLKSILATMEKNSKFYKLKTMISPWLFFITEVQCVLCDKIAVN
jgi:hypothetical protein